MQATRDGRGYRTAQDEPVRTWRVEVARELNASDWRKVTVSALAPEVAGRWAQLEAANATHTSLRGWRVVNVEEIERTEVER